MKNIKNGLTVLVMAAVFAGFAGNVAANDDGDKAPALDLHAVGELFKDADNLEHFEQLLNAPASGINNLDLDENSEVDYIRVVEEVADDTHLIVLQTQFAEDDAQDVATIAVEKESAGDVFNMQIQGAPELYGADYYIVPAAEVGDWSAVRWIFRPAYRPYRSAFGYRIYPRWWRVRRPVAVNVYRTRTINYAGRGNFAATKTVRVKSFTKVNYRVRTSTVVSKKKRSVKKGNTTIVKGGAKKSGAGGTTVKKGMRKTTDMPTDRKTRTKVKAKRTRN